MAFIFGSYRNVNNSNNSIKTFTHKNERKLKENNQTKWRRSRMNPETPNRTQY